MLETESAAPSDKIKVLYSREELFTLDGCAASPKTTREKSRGKSGTAAWTWWPVGMRIAVVHDPKYNLEGHTGIVARYRQESPDKPTVMIMFNRKKEKIKPILIDLLDEPEMRIQFVVLS